MDSDTPLIVNLEVTVPRIVLAASRHRSGQREATPEAQQSSSSESNEAVQLGILPMKLQQEALPRRPQEQLPAISSEASERMSHAVRFRMFRGIVPAEGRPLLFQVWRWHKGYIGGRRRKRKAAEVDNGHLYVSDTSVFSVEFRHRGEEASFTSTSTTIMPGVNRVVIYVDDEGTPGSYSIDGAES